MDPSLYKSIQEPCAVWRIFTNDLTWRPLPGDIWEENGRYSDSILTPWSPNQVHMNFHPPRTWVILCIIAGTEWWPGRQRWQTGSFFASWWLENLSRHEMETLASNSASLRRCKPISPVSQQTFLVTMLFLVDEFSVPFFKWSGRV